MTLAEKVEERVQAFLKAGHKLSSGDSLGVLADDGSVYADACVLGAVIAGRGYAEENSYEKAAAKVLDCTLQQALDLERGYCGWKPKGWRDTEAFRLGQEIRQKYGPAC